MQPHRAISSLVVAGTVAALLAGCGGSGSAQTSTQSVTSSSASSSSGVQIKNFAFRPATLTVAADARVDVTNDDSTAHTFTANDGSSFDTGAIDPGASSRLSALKPGRYAYHCSIHPFMHGTLVVR
jgi:plastocyanin